MNEATDADAKVEVVDCEFFKLSGWEDQIEDAGDLPLAFEPLTRLVVTTPCSWETGNRAPSGEQAADSEVRFAPICDLCRLLELSAVGDGFRFFDVCA